MNKQTMRQKLAALAVVASGAVVANSANAAIDLSEVTGTFTDGGTAAATIGGLALAFVVGIRIFKKIRGAV